MKRILVVLLMPVLAMAQGGQGFTGMSVGAPQLVIKGTIQGLADGTEVTLKNGNDQHVIATAKASKGSFTLKGTANVADIAILSFGTVPQGFDMFLGNDLVTLTGNISDMNNIKVTGSATQADYELFKSHFNALFDQIRATITAANMEKDPARKDSLIKSYNAQKAPVKDAAITFLKEKPASPVSSLGLFVVMPLIEDQQQLAEMFATLKPSAKKGPFAKAIEDKMVGMVGSQALDFTQKDVEGKPVSLASFRGKYVLVDFWASWCRPCRAENPNVVTAYQNFKNKNFTVLGVSLDQQKPSWLEAIKADNLTWTHVSDLQYWNNAVAQLYHISSIPSNMLIDPSGKIIARDIRGEELQNKLREVLK